MSATTPNPQQRAAIAARGTVFVSAGAGTGKTTVLVERFVTAVCDDGLDVGSLLAITYTDRAAGELRSRIATRLRERGRPDLARQLDVAWISTIHGFCRRVLAQYTVAAGVDPRFRVLDEAQSRVLQGEAFGAALERFCADDDTARLQLLATYGAGGLRRMLRSVFETLRSAGRELRLEPGSRLDLDTCVAALATEAASLAADPSATRAQSAAAAETLEVLAAGDGFETYLDLTPLSARGARAAAFNDARRAVVDAVHEELAARDRVLLEELLLSFAEAYQAAKDAESALDFEDLQLRVRDLLRDDPDVREREQMRFRSILVDEFQDTNHLQCQLVDFMAGGPAKDLFFVGDEFQSIYGFRHADVAVFRERRDAAEQVLPLTLNYRSRPEVLAAVNHLFAEEFGDVFEPLEPVAGYGEARFGAPVELVVSDKASYRDAPVHWRRGEARAVARRVAELVEAGVAGPGEIVYLFAAGTDAEVYEEELRAVGLPTYRATGRKYFGQQQVVDLLAYLRLLRNRYDDDALLTVLASPFVGVSNDALAVARAAAPKRPIFTAIERGMPTDMPERDGRLLRAFRQRFDRLVGLSARLPLELLCERIIVEHDYDLAVLARDDGPRRYANLRKLARLARSYEELRGADLEGFIRFVADQEAAGARESDAVAEEDGADAVRLLTIHAAKGLEFKVVVVADAGRERMHDDEILCLSDGRFGFKVAHPHTGSRVVTPSYDDVRETREKADDAERLRLYYVGMTRAMERLIVSGSVDMGRVEAERTPIAWALGRLGAAGELDRAAGEPVEITRGDAGVLLRLDRWDPTSLSRARIRGRGSAARPTGIRSWSCSPASARRCHRGRRGSAISRWCRSPPSFASRVSRSAPCRSTTRARSASGPSGSPASGRAVNRAVGWTVACAPRRSETPCTGCSSVSICRRPSHRRRRSSRSQLHAWYPAVTAVEQERIATFVEAYCSSELAARVAGLEGIRPEVGFAFELDGVLLNGRLDAHWSDGSRALVLDYKTNLLGDSTPEEVVAERLHAAAARLRACLPAHRCRRGGGGLPLPRASGEPRRGDVHPRRRAGARGGAVRRHRPCPRGRVSADTERVRLRRLSCARSRVRGATPRSGVSVRARRARGRVLTRLDANRGPLRRARQPACSRRGAGRCAPGGDRDDRRRRGRPVGPAPGRVPGRAPRSRRPLRVREL